MKEINRFSQYWDRRPPACR